MRFSSVQDAKRQKFERILFLILLDILVIQVCAIVALFFTGNSGKSFLPQELTAALRLYPPQTALINTAITLTIFAILGLYTSLWSFAGADELMHIFFSALLTGLMQLAFISLDIVQLPRRCAVLNSLLLAVVVTAERFSYRLFRRLSGRWNRGPQRRTMLIGAGEAGAVVLREFGNSYRSQNRVVCIIDDNPAKIGKTLMGVRIVGGRDAIPHAAEKYNVSEIVLAIPTLSPSARREILNICRTTGCKCKQLPGIYQLINGEVSIQQIRDVEIEDLLAREVVHVDMDGIGGQIRGKTVMVTGGGGSIGSELCRQLASYHPGCLIIFDIYENNAYAIEQELRQRDPELDIRVLIGSVRDRARIERVMAQFRPAIVYHAAAHKHVPLMENSPLEAVKNNIFGTLNTARAAGESGAEHFVLISTDKAVNPTNVMGASKRVCEMIIQLMDEQYPTVFAAVRFGNVLGSNGSVIPLFREQIRSGGPVTVTHPEITRFFMTIPEAASLVLQAGAYANGGEIFVLDMGKPVKIDDLARNMIRLSGFEPDVDIPVVYTGLRPGEKLYEELLMGEEGLSKTANNLIYVGKKTPFDHAAFLQRLEALRALQEGQHDELRRQLQQIVPTYHPQQPDVSVRIADSQPVRV